MTSCTVSASTPISCSEAIGSRRKVRLRFFAVSSVKPQSIAAQCDVIFSSLPEPADVEAVAIGPGGLLDGVRKGAAYFDLSTNSPSVVKRLSAAFAEKGAHM